MNLRLSLVVLLGLCAANVGAQQIENPANGHLYEMLPAAVWADSKQAAIDAGGVLVTINDQAENDWIVANFDLPANTWIGLTDEVEEGNFVWLSGETPGFGEGNPPVALSGGWNANEPNDWDNGVPGEDSTVIQPGGGWNDADGIGNAYPGLVEIVPEFGFTHSFGTFNVEEGGVISFSVEATSPDSMTITYQWYKNNAAVSGATSSTYTPTTSAALSDDGDEYYVIADDGVTTIQSGTFTITVLAVGALPAAGLVALLVLCALMSAAAVLTLRRKRAL